MKYSIERNLFAKSLAHVTRVVERRNTYPILANVLIEANNDGRLILRATDLDIEITEIVPAAVSEPGITTVPAGLLSDICRKFPDGSEVAFEHADHNAVVKASRSRFNLATLDADQYPDLKSGTFEHSFSLPASGLSRLISKVSFAMSTEETRYYLNGIYFHVADGKLRGVATDGHRMARFDLPLPDGADGMPGVIIPRKTIVELAKLLGDVDGDVTVEVSWTKIRFSLGSMVLLSKLIEGTFPDYDRVTPKGNNKLVSVSKAEISKAVDRVGIMATDRGGKAVKMSFSPGTLTLEVSNSDHGTATEDLPVGGDLEFEIGFNTRYLLDVVSQADSDEVEFAFNDAGSPSLVRDAKGSDSLYVLMPMRV